MNLLQKMRLAVSFAFLPRVDQLKMISGIAPNWQEGQAEPPPKGFENLVKNGWRRNELIYACSSKKARTASQVSLKVFNKRTNEELPDHRLRMLIQNPNPLMSEFDFWSSLFIFQDFAGVAYYEKVRSGSGQVVQLWPLRPDWVRVIPSRTDVIAGYLYGPSDLDPVRLEKEDVLAFPLFDPLNMYKGSPPVAVAARTGDIDNSLTDYVRLLFQEGGVPPGLLKTNQSINDGVGERARKIWRERYGGYKNWLEPAVLGHDLEYQQVGLGIENLGLDILDERSEIRISMVMVCPPTVVGSGVGLDRSTMANAREFHLNWWTDDLIPLYKNHNDALRTGLVADFGDDIYTAWDFHEVPALQALMRERREWALEAFTGSAITRNQFFMESGLPDTGPGGDVYLMSAAMIEVPATQAKGTGKGAGVLLPSSTKIAENAPDDDERRLHEKKVEECMTKFFDGQLNRLVIGAEESISHRPPKEDDAE